MLHKRPSLPVIVLAVLVVLVGLYYGVRALGGDSSSQLKASGTIEATTVNISPELAGKVKEVLVDEGQSVKAGEALLRLDDSLLQAQRQQAVAALNVAQAAASTADAALASAQTQYDLALNASLVQDKGQRISQWVNDAPSDFNLPLWYYSQDEQMDAAQAEVTTAQQALSDAQNSLSALESSSAGSDFMKTENDLANAEATYNVANDLNNRVQNGVNINDLTRMGLFKLAIQTMRSNSNPAKQNSLINASNIDQNIKDYSKQLFDDAKDNLRQAQAAYTTALSSQAAKDILKARALVSLDQEYYNTALDYVSYLRTGNESPSVSTARTALAQAKAADGQAHNAVGQAQANVDLINTQLSKLTVYAPLEGVILTRNVEPGEYVQPGAAALSMANLGELTITVYVPEDRYGEIALGQKATVTVDSFPGVTFTADVSHIADQAEFTPRNVQTVEGRSSTVYAVKLQVTDPSSKLKIGMPADVTFE
jgi:multidrug resistance efflux pump